MKKNEEKWGGEDVETAVAAEVGGEFNALYLAAAEGASVLAEGEVAESDVHHHLQLAVYFGVVEEVHRLFDAEGHHVLDVDSDDLASARKSELALLSPRATFLPR